MDVVWAPSAGRDLQAIYSHIGNENPHAAQRVAEAIIAAAEELGNFPFLGHQGNAGEREWVVPNFRHYLLIYSLLESQVTILRVWHQRRDR